MLQVLVNVLFMVAIPIIVSILIPKPLPPVSWLLVSLFWIAVYIVIPLFNRTSDIVMVVSTVIGATVSYFAMKLIAEKKSKR